MKSNIDTLRFVYTMYKLLEIDVYQKSSVDVNDPLHEQELFLLRPCRNFASVKEGFPE